MDVTAKQKILLKKLKRQIKMLKKREQQSRMKLRTALQKLSKLGQSYKIRLARKMHQVESKLVHSEAVCYAKLAADLEKQLVKGIKKKVRALTAVTKRHKKNL